MKQSKGIGSSALAVLLSASMIAPGAVPAMADTTSKTDEQPKSSSESTPAPAADDETASTKVHHYAFGEDVTAGNVYSDDMGMGLMDYTYPEEAAGWVDKVYHERELNKAPGATYAEDGDNYLKLDNQVWTETEETGYGVYQYENTTGFSARLDPMEYTVDVTFTNPTDSDYHVFVKSEDITKVSDLVVPAGQEAQQSFSSSLIDGVMDLEFGNPSDAKTVDDSATNSVYVKTVDINESEQKEAGEKPTIYLASDSTVQSYEKNFQPQTGWGETLWNFFGDQVEQREAEGCSYYQAEVYEADNALIENRAMGGRSSKSFLQEGKLDELLDDIKPGDYMFVQFGHNDATAVRPNRYVSPDDFEYWMQQYVDGARQRGASCVLVTPVARYSYDADGRFQENFKAYGDVMRRMAQEQNIPLIDLSKASIELCNAFGVEGAESLFLHVKPGEYEGNYANGVTDDTHLQYYGAYKFSQCVARELVNMDTSHLDKSDQTAIEDLKNRVKFEEVSDVPAAVSGLNVVSAGSTSISLSWEKAEASELYYVYRRELKSGETAEDVDFTNAEKYSVSVGTSFVDKKAKKGSTYVYTVRGFNDKGLGEFSGKVEAKTKNSEYSYDINWKNSPTLEGWTGVNNDTIYNADRGYGFKEAMTNGRYRNNSGADDASDMAEDFTLSAGEFMVDVPNGTYEVTVYAGDLLANTSTIKSSFTMEGKDVGSISAKRSLGSLTVNVEVTDGQLNIGIGGTNPYFNGCEITSVLLAPSGVSISEKSYEGDRMTFLLGFNPVEHAVSYNIYGKTSTEQEFRQLKSFTTEEYERDELACRAMTANVGESYEYYMTAVMKDGTETVPSNLVKLDVLNPDVNVPEKPANLKAEKAADFEKKITWDADDRAEQYVIYRSETADGNFKNIGTGKEASFTDQDHNLLADHTYYYRVQAKNGGGTSEMSDALEIKPLTGEAVAAKAETLTDRALVAINLAGADGGEKVVTATDKDGKEYDHGVYLSWRSFEKDPKDNTYDVYRGDKKIAEKITATNLLDEGGDTSDIYKVVGGNDKELGLKSHKTKVWEKKYLELQLYKPDDQTMPDGTICHFTANDMSVGDLDGDGQLELIVKWYPSNAQDNSKGGYTGTTILDGYNIDFSSGKVKLLWRINLGVNIRSGAHYTQSQVWDYDGDGKAEIAMKTADGSTTYVSKDGTDKTLEETAYIGACDADVLPTDVVSKNHDYRSSNGYVLTGPEYFSIFNGEDGSLIGTTDYNPPRKNVSDWGDGYGNRVDRFLAGTAYLDGKAPYAVFVRGYYTRMVVNAYYLADTDGDGIGDSIRTKWVFDTDEYGKEPHGNHNLSVADVDRDGKDEISFGSMTLDNDGSVLYDTGLGHGDAIHLGDFVAWNDGLEVMSVKEENNAKYHVLIHDAATGKILMGYYVGRDTGRGAADDIDPTSPGSEFWAIVADNYNPEDGEPSWDSGKGAVYATTSTLDNLVRLNQGNPAANGLMYWDGDLLREIQDHVFNEKDGYVPVSTDIYKWDYQNGKQVPLLQTTEAYTSNGTKGNPGISGDLLGDWREEMILRCADDDSKIRIYSTTIQTDYVVPCLLEDQVYREGLAWQNTAYNQPPHLSYALSEGLITSKVNIPDATVTGDSVTLTFTKASDGKNGHEVQGYEIYRAREDGDYELIDKVTLDKLQEDAQTGTYTYTDKGLDGLTKYNYRIAAAVNGRSAHQSKTVSAVTKEPAVAVDKSALKRMLDYASSLKETQESGTELFVEDDDWTEFLAAIDQAKGIYENDQATKKKADAALNHLVDTLDALKAAVSKAGLKAAIDGANKIVDSEEIDKYTKKSADALKKQLKKAEKVYENKNSTQNSVNQAMSNLLTAVSELMVKIHDYSNLENLVESSKSMYHNEKLYTSGTYKSFKSAYDAAAKILKVKDSTQEEINQAYDNLQSAKSGLKRVSNKEELATAIKNAEKILSRRDRYVPETLEGLSELTDEAKQVNDNTEATQTEVDQIVTGLVDKLMKVRVTGDVNSDGKVDTKDASAILQYLAELTDLSEGEALSADVNRDHVVDSKDSREVLRYAAEIIPSFDAAG